MAEYEELIEALRHCYEDDDACATCQRWLAHDEWGIKCKGRLISDAAAAIEALQAQLPKLGEWQKAKPKGVVTYSDGYAECSHCHEKIWLGWGMNFCPHCGTQNKIIDPDDYDGAKMEVQDG